MLTKELERDLQLQETVFDLQDLKKIGSERVAINALGDKQFDQESDNV